MDILGTEQPLTDFLQLQIVWMDAIMVTHGKAVARCWYFLRPTSKSLTF